MDFAFSYLELKLIGFVICCLFAVEEFLREAKEKFEEQWKNQSQVNFYVINFDSMIVIRHFFFKVNSFFNAVGSAFRISWPVICILKF